MTATASRLCLMAKLSDITYSIPTVATPLFSALGYTVKNYFSVKNSQGYLLENNAERVLTFRGTQVHADNYLDLTTDALGYTTPADPPAIGWSHIGFTGAVRDLWTPINTALAALTTVKPLSKHRKTPQLRDVVP